MTGWAGRGALAAGALLGAVCALALGQDSGHDLRNYHWYNPWALLNGRLSIDLAPAQLQTYFNPSLDLLYYGLIQGLGPQWGAAAMGALQGMCVPLLWIVGERTLAPGRQTVGRVLQLTAALAGCLGVVSLTVLGASRGDGLVAVGVLGGLVLLLRATSLGRVESRMGFFLAGAAFGATVGLKPTALAYAGGACLAVGTGAVSRTGRLGWLLVGSAAGLTATGGWWAAILFRRFGNPVFPMANNLFRSDWASPSHHGQTYAIAQGPLDLLTRPFQILQGDALGWELPFGDDRLALTMTLAAAVLAWHGLCRLRGVPSRVSSEGPEREATHLLFRFVGFSYLVWMLGSGYFRFQLPLEALAPILLLLLLERLTGPGRLRQVGGAVLLLAVLLPVRSGPGGRIPFGEDLLGLSIPELEPLGEGEERTVLLAGEDPVAYVATGFPLPSRFVCLVGNMTHYEPDPAMQATSDRTMQRAIRKTLREARGPLYVLVGPTGIDEAALRAYGLRRNKEDCRRITTRMQDEDIELCTVQREEERL